MANQSRSLCRTAHVALRWAREAGLHDAISNHGWLTATLISAEIAFGLLVAHLPPAKDPAAKDSAAKDSAVKVSAAKGRDAHRAVGGDLYAHRRE